jgi:hypothetical protein
MSELGELLARSLAAGDPAAEVALAAALARAAHPLSIGALRALANDPQVEVRLLVQVGLARLADDDAAVVTSRLTRESDLGVLAILAARAGRLPIDARALANLIALAAYPGTPAELRAGCAWAIGERDRARGAEVAGSLLDDDEATFWLASIVGRRGGAFGPLVTGLHGEPALDRVAALLDL